MTALKSSAGLYLMWIGKMRLVLCASAVGAFALTIAAKTDPVHLSGREAAKKTPNVSVSPRTAQHDGHSAKIASIPLGESIDLAADYLVAATQPNGRFIYRVNLNPRFSPGPKYNMLRHAGTVFALARYEKCSPRKEVREAMLRAAEFLKREAIAPIHSANAKAAWSRPATTKTSLPLQAKLGGTGLALVALLSVDEVQPGFTDLEELRSLGRFILFMQKNDGSFYSKYVPEEGGRTDNWTSLYYPGEAALGLIMLYEKDLQRKWLRAASKALAYLANKRQDQAIVEADHWALLATARLLLAADNLDERIDHQQLVAHGRQICHSILSGQPAVALESVKLNGAFTPDGRTCPTATRLEGLLAALSFLPPDDVLPRERVTSAITDGIAFLQRAQIRQPGPNSGAIPRAIHPLPKSSPFYSPTFNRRALEVRIDYVQHALCAMIEYRQSRLRLNRQPTVTN